MTYALVLLWQGKVSSPAQMAACESLLPPPFKLPLAALGLHPRPLPLQYGARLSDLVRTH